MREKLSVRKVFRNAYRYVISHPFAFLFLTVFYFLGSLLPILTGTDGFKLVAPFYNYLFFYFAAGCYYQQRILVDRQVFVAAGVRFIVAIVLFLTALFMSHIAINALIYSVCRLSALECVNVSQIIHGNVWGIIAEYSFIFILFVMFFIVPSFAFVAEITGKNRSLLITFAKTKGNYLKIGAVSLGGFLVLLVTMVLLANAHFLITTFIRSLVLVYISILYFKMYDFFYTPPYLNKHKEEAESKDNSLRGDDNAH